MTRRIGINEARPILGDLVTAAQQGQDIIITRHGRPAATLTAYQEEIAMWEIEFPANSAHQADMIILDALRDGSHRALEGGRHGWIYAGGREDVEAVRDELVSRGQPCIVTKRASA